MKNSQQQMKIIKGIHLWMPFSDSSYNNKNIQSALYSSFSIVLNASRFPIQDKIKKAPIYIDAFLWRSEGDSNSRTGHPV